MGVVNRRNAMLGWFVWQMGKRLAKRKARDAVPAFDTDTKRPNRPAIVSLLAAAGGALLFWRWWKSEDSPEPFE